MEELEVRAEKEEAHAEDEAIVIAEVQEASQQPPPHFLLQLGPLPLSLSLRHYPLLQKSSPNKKCKI